MDITIRNARNWAEKRPENIIAGGLLCHHMPENIMACGELRHHVPENIMACGVLRHHVPENIKACSVPRHHVPENAMARSVLHHHVPDTDIDTFPLSVRILGLFFLHFPLRVENQTAITGLTRKIFIFKMYKTNHSFVCALIVF